jgi:type IV pilus assembly protein PilY1
MGGGYDPAEDDGSTLTMGNGVYVIDPLTGARLGYLPTDYSVPSDVSFLDTDGDNLVDRGYVIDVRANVYRIDIEDASGTPYGTDSFNWKITKIADFNDSTGKRRVYFAPDVVRTSKFIALMLGTGNREKPLETNTNDRFFIMKDRNVKKGQPESVTVLKEDDTAKVVEVGPDALKNNPEACYVRMTGTGEKVINQPVTFGGVTYFSTSRPSTGGKTCSTILSKAYQVPLVCQKETATELVGDGLPPSPVVGYVEVTGADGKDTVVPFVIGGPNTKKSSIEVGRPNLSIPGNRKRSYWYMRNQDR